MSIITLTPDQEATLSALVAVGDFASIEAAARALLDERLAERAIEDDLIGPVFRRAVADWEHHFETIRDFWSKTLRGSCRYGGNPFSAHIRLDLRPEFFDRWLELFRLTAREELPPAASDRAIAKVEHMSSCFQAGLFLPSV